MRPEEPAAPEPDREPGEDERTKPAEGAEDEGEGAEEERRRQREARETEEERRRRREAREADKEERRRELRKETREAAEEVAGDPVEELAGDAVELAAKASSSRGSSPSGSSRGGQGGGRPGEGPSVSGGRRGGACDNCDCDGCVGPCDFFLLTRMSTLLLIAAALVPEVGGTAVVRAALRLYRRRLTRFTPRCPSTPSCSAYAMAAVESLGPRRGLAAAAGRVRDCGPPPPTGR